MFALDQNDSVRFKDFYSAKEFKGYSLAGPSVFAYWPSFVYFDANEEVVACVFYITVM